MHVHNIEYLESLTHRNPPTLSNTPYNLLQMNPSEPDEESEDYDPFFKSLKALKEMVVARAAAATTNASNINSPIINNRKLQQQQQQPSEVAAAALLQLQTDLDAAHEAIAEFKRKHGEAQAAYDGLVPLYQSVRAQLEVAQTSKRKLLVQVDMLQKKVVNLTNQIAAEQAQHNQERVRADTAWKERDGMEARFLSCQRQKQELLEERVRHTTTIKRLEQEIAEIKAINLEQSSNKRARGNEESVELAKPKKDKDNDDAARGNDETLKLPQSNTDKDNDDAGYKEIREM
jgi:chromosome segregation ATPase